MRLIDADELTETINKALETPCYNAYQDGYDAALNTLLDYIADMPTIPAAQLYIIDQMPTIPAPQWISVEERLPDVDKTQSGYEKQYVIAATKNGVRPLIFERACIGNKVVRRWKWAWDRIYDGSPVTHWMPLPEPPKGEKS